MSHLHTLEIELKDQDILLEVLNEMGFMVDTYDNPVHIMDYYNRKIDKTASLIIDKIKNRLNADIGFGKNKDGFFEVTMDAMDSKRLDIKRLKQLYTKQNIKQTVKKKSSKFSIKSETVDENGSIKLKVKVRSN